MTIRASDSEKQLHLHHLPVICISFRHTSHPYLYLYPTHRSTRATHLFLVLLAVLYSILAVIVSHSSDHAQVLALQPRRSNS